MSTDGNDVFEFAIPTLPRVASNSVVPSTSDPPQGLNIFANSPTTGNEQFVSANSFADALNANDWDALLESRTGSNAFRASRWDRDSLFQHFDPLASRRLSPQHRPQTAITRPGHVHTNGTEQEFFGVSSSTNVIVEEEGVIGVDLDPHNVEEARDDNEQLMIKFERFSHFEREDSNNTFRIRSSDSHVDFDQRSELDPNLVSISPHSSCGPDSPTNEVSPVLSSHSYGSRNFPPDSTMDTALTQQGLHFKAELAEKEKLIKELEEKLEDIIDKNEIVDVGELDKLNKEIEDYKSTVLILKEQNCTLECQYEQLSEEIKTVEANFIDILGKYERVKDLLESAVKNERVLVERDHDMQAKLAEANAHIDEIQAEIKAKLEAMHQNYEAKVKEAAGEANTLRAQLRKAELRIEVLESDGKQKTSEIAKLNKLCDDLIEQRMH